MPPTDIPSQSRATAPYCQGAEHDKSCSRREPNDAGGGDRGVAAFRGATGWRSGGRGLGRGAIQVRERRGDVLGIAGWTLLAGRGLRTARPERAGQQVPVLASRSPTRGGAASASVSARPTQNRCCRGDGSSVRGPICPGAMRESRSSFIDLTDELRTVPAAPGTRRAPGETQWALNETLASAPPPAGRGLNGNSMWAQRTRGGLVGQHGAARPGGHALVSPRRAGTGWVQHRPARPH